MQEWGKVVSHVNNQRISIMIHKMKIKSPYKQQ